MAKTVLPRPERIPRYLLGFGVLLTLVTAGETLLRVVGVAGPNTPFVFAGEFLVGVLTTVPFVVLLGYAGHWLERSDLGSERYVRIGVWAVGGTISFLVINLALMAVMPVEPWTAVAWARWAVAVGGGIGVLVGVSEARAVHSAIEAERAALEAEHLESQRDLLEYLNALLRHEVLNAANVISGYAAALMDEHPSDELTHDYSETIRDQSDDMAAVIRDVRVLLDAIAGESDPEPVDLGAVIEEEVAKLEDAHDRVEVEAAVPAVHVRANVLLSRVFGNLLSNAVEHNDGDTPRVTVSAETTVDTVTLEVADDGPGLPDGVVDTLFERPETLGADHGIGLYLVSMLVDSYGGTIELAETGPDGSTFAVELPRDSPVLVDRVMNSQTAPISS